MNDIVKSPLLAIVFNALEADSSFQAAADCISTMVRETREIDDNIETIQVLLPRIIALRPKIQKVVEEEDVEEYEGEVPVGGGGGV